MPSMAVYELAHTISPVLLVHPLTVWVVAWHHAVVGLQDTGLGKAFAWAMHQHFRSGVLC